MNETEVLYRQILTRLDQIAVQKIQIEERIFNHTRDIMMLDSELNELTKLKDSFEIGGTL